MHSLATDVGGTFTDLAVFDKDTGQIHCVKCLSTPGDFSEGVMRAISLSDVDATSIERFVHGGTTVINAITERKGVKTALITTRGFRDVLEIARGNRPDLYNLRFVKPKTFVPRHLRFEVDERVYVDGTPPKYLDLDELGSVVDECLRQDVEAIAIVFLRSYINSHSEEIAADFIRKAAPGVAVVPSHEVTREWREYERSSTTVLNAYVQPIVQQYFTTLEDAVRERGVSCPLTAMQSNGGTTSFQQAKDHPITLIESGPAGGINGAAVVKRLVGADSAVYLEVGGTTAKTAVIQGDEPATKTDYYIERSRIDPGHPVMVPVVDLVEIGSGGGSIAWIDPMGRLRVGPQSAGSQGLDQVVEQMRQAQDQQDGQMRLRGGGGGGRRVHVRLLSSEAWFGCKVLPDEGNFSKPAIRQMPPASSPAGVARTGTGILGFSQRMERSRRRGDRRRRIRARSS